MAASVKYKNSMGNGYGIHRGHKAESALGLAVPPHAGGAKRKPGGIGHHKNVNFTRKHSR